MTDTPAHATKQVLRQASGILRTANPLEAGFDRLVDEALQLPRGDRAYQRGYPKAFDAGFSELGGRTLAIGMEPGGPLAPPDYRISHGAQVVGELVRRHMGPDAARWVAARSEEARGSGYGATRWGAAIGASFDDGGVREASVSYEWGPTLLDSLPASLYRLARTAMELVPGLRPAFTTVHVGRTTGSQRLTFSLDTALRLGSLEPLMGQLGIGHQHASLMSACAFILGARFVLPPDTALVTLRQTRSGIELRLDVDLDALPDVPQPLTPLIQLQMAERPRSIDQWQQWLSAFTQEGYPSAGAFSVLSIVVRPDLPARIALHLRPAAIDAEPEDRRDREDGFVGWAGPESAAAWR
jgi:hypothetical protein